MGKRFESMTLGIHTNKTSPTARRPNYLKGAFCATENVGPLPARIHVFEWGFKLSVALGHLDTPLIKFGEEKKSGS